MRIMHDKVNFSINKTKFGYLPPPLFFGEKDYIIMSCTHRDKYISLVKEKYMFEYLKTIVKVNDCCCSYI